MSPTPKTRTGPGGDLYRDLAPQCQPFLCTGLHCVDFPHKPACPHAAARAQSSVWIDQEPDRCRAEAREALCAAARPRSAARRRSSVSYAVRRDRQACASQIARRCARTGHHGFGHRRQAPTFPAASFPRALPHLCARRYRRHHSHVFQCAPRLSGETAAGRRDPLCLRHCRVLRRHPADGSPRPSRRRGRFCRAPAGRAGLSSYRRIGAGQCPSRNGQRARTPSGDSRMAGRSLDCPREISGFQFGTAASSPPKPARRHPA
jgi:hypothetical protein